VDQDESGQFMQNFTVKPEDITLHICRRRRETNIKPDVEETGCEDVIRIRYSGWFLCER
jgi:hypothetical protein